MKHTCNNTDTKWPMLLRVLLQVSIQNHTKIRQWDLKDTYLTLEVILSYTLSNKNSVGALMKVYFSLLQFN